MKRVLAAGAGALAVGFAFVAPAGATTVNLATGYSGGSLATGGGQADDNWTVSGANNFENAPTAYTVGSGNADWFGGWFANGPSSYWIAADPDTPNNGDTAYTFTFNLTAAEAASASITGGQWTIDDAGTLYLNGDNISSIGSGQWGGFHPFTTSAGDFVAGRNTLVMQTTGADNYLEAARLEGSLNYTPASGTPEPATWALMLLGIGSVGAGLRLRRMSDTLIGA